MDTRPSQRAHASLLAPQHDDTADDTGITQALAALQHPDIAAAINAIALLQRPDVAAALAVLQRVSNLKCNERVKCNEHVNVNRSEAAPASAKSKRAARKLIKPAVTNNLFVITVLWNIIGMFLLYAADRCDGVYTVTVEVRDYIVQGAQSPGDQGYICDVRPRAACLQCQSVTLL